MGRSRAAPAKRPSAAPPQRPSSSMAAPPPRAPPPAPAPAPHAPAPMQQQGGGMLSGLGATIAQGMAFGTGSAIAHRAVGAIAGSFGGSDTPAAAPQAAVAQQQPQASSYSAPSQEKCSVDLQAFNNCMQENRGSVQACDFYFQALQQCQNSNY